jgi:hypothetical protein
VKYDKYERDARAFDEAYERALTLLREESNAVGAEDRIDVTCRVFRSAKDVADAMLERRLHGQRQDE